MNGVRRRAGVARLLGLAAVVSVWTGALARAQAAASTEQPALLPVAQYVCDHGRPAREATGPARLGFQQPLLFYRVAGLRIYLFVSQKQCQHLHGAVLGIGNVVPSLHRGYLFKTTPNGEILQAVLVSVPPEPQGYQYVPSQVQYATVKTITPEIQKDFADTEAQLIDALPSLAKNTPQR